MCFSATASFTAGAALVVTGVITISLVTRKTHLPFALIPLLFGIQQTLEGLIWLSFRYSAPSLNTVATHMYAIFAYVLWPIFVPFAIGLLETVPWRKRVMYIFQVMGLIVGGYLFIVHLQSPVSCEIVNHSIVYTDSGPYPFWIPILYGAATIFTSLFSSEHIIRVFGVLALLSATIAYWFYDVAFVSVWCFFAAIVSFMIYVYLVRKHRA